MQWQRAICDKLSHWGAILSDFPHAFDPTSSILFLGAGFSADATNIGDKTPPVGTGLEKAIRKLCELPDDDSSDLKDLASYAVAENKDLFGLLNDTYTIKSLNQDQKDILGQKWLRIYTTNYDDSIEFFWQKDGIEFKKNTYSIETDLPKQTLRGDAIHLHGYIHHCNKENLLSQLILSHFSYAQQRAIKSPWWHLFSKDLRIAQNIFFVGYELNDFEPASYLSANPDLAGKTHFILRPTDSPVKASRLRPYGSRHGISTSGFAQECRNAKAADKPAHANSLQSFRFVDPLKDKKPAIKPSVLEIQSLLSFGKFNFQRLLSTFPESEYVLVRKRHLDELAADLKKSKTVIVHSKVGNGKSIFCETASLYMTTIGYQCFELKEHVTPPDAEIDFIRSQAKSVVLFPSYESAYNNIHLFSGMNSNFISIIQMQTSTLQVRNSEVNQAFQKPITRININNFDSEEFKEIYRMLDKAGVASREMKLQFSSGGEFRDLVISIFENQSIIDKIDAIIKPIISNAEARAVILCSALLKVFGLTVDPAFLKSVIPVDIYQTLLEAGEGAHEIVAFSYDAVDPHSALLSLFLVQRYLKAYEISAAVFNMASEAARIMNEDPSPQSERVRIARSTLGALLRFSALDEILNKHADRSSLIADVYEHGRRDTYIQGEPLFWLQYSIFMQNSGEWRLAEKHMDTAYDRAAAREKFLTYQLDTNSLGLYIELEMRAKDAQIITRNEKILDRLDAVNSMISEGNHRGHALRVLNKMEQFVEEKKYIIKRDGSEQYILRMNLIIDQLDNISIEDRIILGSDDVKFSLMRAVNALTG